MHPHSNRQTDNTGVLKSKYTAMIELVNKLSLEIRQAEQERTIIMSRLDLLEDTINDIMKNIGQLWIKSNI